MPRRPALPKKGPGSRKMQITMEEFSAGTLRDNAGNIVTNRKQAQAIGASKARRTARKAK